MTWQKNLMGFFTILTLGAMIASPAVAGQVKRFIDSQGKIHINNDPGTQDISQNEPQTLPTLPPRVKLKRKSKEEKLRLLEERRGQLPAVPWSDKEPSSLHAGDADSELISVREGQTILPENSARVGGSAPE